MSFVGEDPVLSVHRSSFVFACVFLDGYSYDVVTSYISRWDIVRGDN